MRLILALAVQLSLRPELPSVGQLNGCLDLYGDQLEVSISREDEGNSPYSNVIPLKLFLGMVPSSLAVNVTTYVFLG